MEILIYLNDLSSDEEIAKNIMKQILLVTGTRRAILDYLLNNLCKEINHSERNQWGFDV